MTLPNTEDIIKELKREIRELKKDVAERTSRETFYQERLDSWADKNFELRQQVLKNEKKLP